jgi:hypothetical protein
MPAKNPVIGVVVPEATHAAIKRVAALQGRSKSAVVRDFLVETTPILERIAAMLELAYKAEGQWPADLVSKLERMQAGLEINALGAMEALDVATADMAAHRRGAPGRRAEPNPPMTNRGVTDTRTPHQPALDLRKVGRPPAGAERRKLRTGKRRR